MIVKILKGRNFGGLLDYLFDPQDKPQPTEIEVGSSQKNQSINEEPSLTKEHSSETNRAKPIKERLLDDSTEGKQRGYSDETGNAKREQRGELLITNMAGRSKGKLREHFEALAALRPDVEVNVLHGILSMPKEDVLSRETKVQIVLRFAELKGLDRTMFAAIEHKEEGHKHTEIHVISSTIDFKGRLPSDSFDYDKGEAIARQLEKEFNLKPNRSSRDSMSRAPTQGEWKQHERTGKLSRPLRLQALVNAALDREVTFTEFQERLERRGVTLRLLINDEGKVTGSVYEFEGKHVRGRRLGRGYTWLGLQRNWPDQQERKGKIDYDSKRDHAAFSRSRSSAMGGRGTNESGEPEQRMGAVVRDGATVETTGREAGANRKTTDRSSAISEEGRGALRGNRPRGEGTARRDGGASQEHRDKSQPVQYAGDNHSEPDNEEFQHQLKILQVFFDETLKISDKNEQMVGQCQDMVATSSAVYHKGSAGVQEISEKTQAHLKAAAEAHRKEIEVQAQHFKTVYKRLSTLIVIGTIVILLSAFAAGTVASALWFYMRQNQAEETSR